MIAEIVANVITDNHAGRAQRQLAREWLLELLDRPYTAAEAAEKLGVSKPTAIKWLRAGLVGRARNTSPRDALFDAASVLSTRELLQKLKMTGTVAERARLIAELPERLYWGVNTRELEALEQSLREADRGNTTAVSDKELARGRDLLDKRRTLVRERAARRRQRRKAPGTAA
jgi:DNA-binding transcriptional MerR regulator